MADAVVVLGTLVAALDIAIALYTVPRIGAMIENPGRLVRATQVAISGLFLGGATSHLAAVYNAATGQIAGYTDPDYLLITGVIPRIFQVIGGCALMYLATYHLDFHFHTKHEVELVAERERLLRRLQELATHDELTGLLNRRAFEQELEEHLRYVDRYGETGGVLYLDLDGFKQANDMYGHQAGDQVLQQAANRLRSTIRKTDVVARMGGDEFAVLLRDAGPAECVGTAERVVMEISKIHDPAPVRASVGVAICTDAATNLVSLADEAMYQAKRSGGNRFAIA